MAAAAHPGRRVCHPAAPPGIPASQRRLHGDEGLLPADTMDRVRRAVRLCRARPDRGRVPAAEQGRMTETLGRRGASRYPSGPMRALHAEWTKVRTVPGTFWLLAAAIVLTVTGSAAAVAATRCPAGLACPVDTARLTLTGVQLGQALIAMPAVLVISSEYSTGMIRITLAAMPRRP